MRCSQHQAGSLASKLTPGAPRCNHHVYLAWLAFSSASACLASASSCFSASSMRCHSAAERA